jgi:hypothetical protein
LAAPTEEEHTVVKASSGDYQLKLKRLTTTENADVTEYVRGHVSQTSTKSRISKLKSKFFVNEETIKLPRAVVDSRTVALAAVRTATKIDDGASAPVFDVGGTMLPIDTTGPMFQCNSREENKRKDFLDLSKQCTMDRFLEDLKSQRESLTSRFDRDRFDLVWG